MSLKSKATTVFNTFAGKKGDLACALAVGAVFDGALAGADAAGIMGGSPALMLLVGAGMALAAKQQVVKHDRQARQQTI